MSAATNARTDRVLATVDPKLAVKVRMLLAQMSADGYPMMATDGNRTAEEQYALYIKGRFGNPGRVVTNADGFVRKSNHQGGRAVDCTFLDLKEKPHWPEPTRDAQGRITGPWALYGKRAKALGLRWGGDFKSMKGGDCPHVELP